MTTKKRETTAPKALAAPYGKNGHAQKDKINHKSAEMADYHIGLPGDLHSSTTVLVLDTANLMGQKLMAAQLKYGFTNGWQDTNWKNPKDNAIVTDENSCRFHAFHHMLKGDPIDVINYMAFMLYHGWSCAPQSSGEASAMVDMLQSKFELDIIPGTPVVQGNDEMPELFVNIEGVKVDDRESAQKLVGILQEKYDLLDDNQILRDLMEKMEERHGEEFNHFFEATLRQVMLGSGMTELTINTTAVLGSIATGARLEVKELPGKLVYTMMDDVEVSDE